MCAHEAKENYPKKIFVLKILPPYILIGNEYVVAIYVLYLQDIYNVYKYCVFVYICWVMLTSCLSQGLWGGWVGVMIEHDTCMVNLVKK